MNICVKCHRLETDLIDGKPRQFRYLGLDGSGTPRNICEVCDTGVYQLSNLFDDTSGDEDWQAIIDEPYG